MLLPPPTVPSLLPSVILLLRLSSSSFLHLFPRFSLISTVLLWILRVSSLPETHLSTEQKKKVLRLFCDERERWRGNDRDDDERDDQMLTEGERGRKESRKEYRRKKTREGCGGREREGEGDGKKRAHCSKSMKTGRWMEKSGQQIKTGVGDEKKGL